MLYSCSTLGLGSLKGKEAVTHSRFIKQPSTTSPQMKSPCNGAFKQSEYNFNEPEKQAGRMHMQLFVEIMLAWLRSGPLPVYGTGQINQQKEKILSCQL